jgi:glycosyltransferase involved in cell wall biosynthesis
VLEGRASRQADAYHLGHVVALTSISEGFPYTVVEAMACGLPVVCTNVGGVAEAVAEAGYVVPPRDYHAVARACVDLLRDAELRSRLGAQARERVLANFTLTQSLDAYRRIYDDLASEAAAAAAGNGAAGGGHGGGAGGVHRRQSARGRAAIGATGSRPLRTVA